MDPTQQFTGSGSLKTTGFAFSSTLPAHLRHEVEALFFFNPRQTLLSSAIYDTIKQTGVPSLMEADDRLWIGVPSGEFQCLFVSDCRSQHGCVAGVALYGRPFPNMLSIVHLAVNAAYILGGGGAGAGAGLLLIQKIKEIAQRIDGITRIQLPYRDQGSIRV